MKTLDPFAHAADLFDPPERDYRDSPGAFAQWLDKSVVQTPALDLIDDHLVGIRDGLATMFKRRAVFQELMATGDMTDAEALQASADRVEQIGIDRLIVSMPPQEGKTDRVSRRSVLWNLCQFMGLRVGIVSYDGDNAARMSFAVRTDIETYQGEDGLPDLGIRLVYGQKAMSRWTLAAPHGGGVIATGIAGGLTGKPLDMLIVDDPVKDIKAADSLLISSDTWNWWSTVARPRLAPGAPVIVVATRWHESDLSGRLQKAQEENEAYGVEHYDRWVTVNIPAQAEDENDPLEREPGTFMSSARGRSKEQWEATKQETPPRHWQALYQGRPTPEEGEIWLRPWWRRYNEAMLSRHDDGSYRVEGMSHVLQSWDLAFKNLKSSDYVVGQVWAKRGADAYLLYQVWARLSFTETLAAIQRMSKLFPQAHRKIVEEAANGAAVIDSLRRKLPGLIPCKPTKSKLERAHAVSPFIQAGNVHLPTAELATLHPDIAWDPEGFITETTQFPNATHDDQVDACSQALHELFLGRAGELSISADAPGTVIPRRLREVEQELQPWQRRIAKRSGVH